MKPIKYTKFLLYVRYDDESGKTSEYRVLSAQTLPAAVEEAEKVFKNVHTRTRLVRLMSREGKVKKESKAVYAVTFAAVLCKRTMEDGWHRNSIKNGETKQKVTRYVNIADKTEWYL